MLEELFCAHRAELTAYCRGLCRSDAAAQDMVQEVFLRAWQNIGTLQDLGPSQRRAWLYRTARNLFVDAMRRTAREAAALPELEPEPETPDPDFAEAEARRLLELLTPAEQELFRKRYLEGYRLIRKNRPSVGRSYSASATWKATPQRNWEKCTVCRLPPCAPGWPKPADT